MKSTFDEAAANADGDGDDADEDDNQCQSSNPDLSSGFPCTYV